MELHQLRYLRAVVRTGSITAAAASEHVAQPSISKQIQTLERELSTPLFHRVGRRVLPTEAALALADCADRVLDDLKATAAAIADPSSALGGNIRICATETIVNHLLPAAINSLRRQVRDASVHVEMRGTADVIATVLADEVDLGLLPLPVADARLQVKSLFAEDVLAVVPRGHRWGARPHVALADVLKEPDLVLSFSGMGLRSQVDAAAQAIGIQVASRVEIRSQQALLSIVAAGAGVTFAPRMSLLGRSDLVALPTRPRLRREIGWIRRRGRYISPVGTRLLGLLSQPAPANTARASRAPCGLG
jgi:DNA-binding transcriptional LysR family regulator